MSTLGELLSALARERFFGTIEVKFEAGKVVLLRKTETIKPTEQDCRENRGESNDREAA